jgi:hypothetical protein
MKEGEAEEEGEEESPPPPTHTPLPLKFIPGFVTGCCICRIGQWWDATLILSGGRRYRT